MLPQTMPPPPYVFQDRACKRVVESFRQYRRIVLVSPTGSGKTVMAAIVMARMHEQFKHVVAISDRLSLQAQNRARLCPTFTPQSLLNGVPDGFGKPDLVIWDECHKSAAEAYRTVFERFPKAKVLGLTATPQRSDGLALDEFEHMEVAAHYSELLFNGTIVPCRVVVPEGFYDDKEPDLFHAYVDNRDPDARGILFCKSIEQAEDVALKIKNAEPYHCHKSNRHNREVLAAFRAGNIEALTTVDALGEGLDVPEVNTIVLGQKCETVTTYLQRCGRGLRAARGKDHATVIDCSGASIRHGSPTEDRFYSIDGAGIQRRGGSGQSWDYDREREQKTLKPYRAKFKVLFGWKNPTADDKRRQLGWLREHAARNGYGEEIAAQCFAALFGESPPSGKGPGSRSGSSSNGVAA